MGTMTTTPEAKVKRDYAKIPLELLDAILDQMDAKANGMLEVSFAMGGVAKIFATVKKVYK